MPKASATIRCFGIVQGVGFRPFVYRLATSLGLRGYVANVGDAHVEIVVEGLRESISRLVEELRGGSSAASFVEEASVEWGEYLGRFSSFEIRPSRVGIEFFGSTLPPDIAICDDCISDIERVGSRWYNYPFTCCAHCGPRFTATYALPYDRENTNMRNFPMCQSCLKEYCDPNDRRFHAQGICCTRCGPRVFLVDSKGRLVESEDPIAEAARLLRKGFIVGVKGIGGFHIACDASRDDVVEELRMRRRRPQQPFAVMSLSLRDVEEYALVTGAERELLTSWRRPIVLLRKREPFPLSELVAPGLDVVGAMLPYTGIHYLLLRNARLLAVVMTSGNLPGLPMAISNDEALEKLGEVVDYFLMHDREIVRRCDDSVMRVFDEKPLPIRRSRGYVPEYVRIGFSIGDAWLAAFGAELRNTICILHGDRCLVSQHIGDVENLETLDFLREALTHLLNLFRADVSIDFVACDLHPRYLSTRYAKELSEKIGARLIPVQHHHAHAVSLMVDNGLDPSDSAVVIAADGVGYGVDGSIWGGEVLEVSFRRFVRRGCLKPHLMPGGDRATLYPLRMLISYLMGAWEERDVIRVISHHVEKGLPKGWDEYEAVKKDILFRRSPMTSSAGRLLDAAAALLGVCYRRTYEGEPAMKLEALANEASGKSPPAIEASVRREGGLLVVDSSEIIAEAASLYLRGVSAAKVALAVERALANGLAEAAAYVAEEKGIEYVGFSGGVAANLEISRCVKRFVEERGLRFLRHVRIPPGDGGISLGQAAAAAAEVCDL